MSAPRVLIVDGHAVVRQGLRRLLDQHAIEVIGEAWTEVEACQLARELCPEVVVLGFSRPFSSCLSVAAAVLRAQPQTNVILLAFEDYLVGRAFQTGIRGYVLKSRLVEHLPQAILAVARGAIYLSQGIPLANVMPTQKVPSGTRSEAELREWAHE
jgi:DNA-binding NarL/FixJ family response regulator